jgi:hypothetical protein
MACDFTVRTAEPVDMSTRPMLSAMAGSHILVLMLNAIRAFYCFVHGITSACNKV